MQEHNNRIFSIKAHPDDANILVSSGWDGIVKIYDIRIQKPVASIVTSRMSGDALDIYDDMIFAGSYQNKSNMNMLSLKNMQVVDTFNFNQSLRDSSSGYLFSSRFSQDGNFLIAGGAGMN